MNKDLKRKTVLNVFDNMANEYVEYFELFTPHHACYIRLKDNPHILN